MRATDDNPAPARAALMETWRHRFPWAACCLAALLAAATARAQVAGTLELVVGEVSVLDADGQRRPARPGGQVAEGETLVTGAHGEAQLRMADDAYLALRPASQVTLARYQARGEATDTAVLRLLRGTLRSITGWIGRTRRDRYRILTPTATIGVRGTDHEPLVTAGGPGVEAGTYDKVNDGAVVLENPHGHLVLGAGQAGFAPAARPPRRLARPPGLYRPTPNEPRIERRKRELAARLRAALRNRRMDHPAEGAAAPPDTLPPAVTQRIKSGALKQHRARQLLERLRRRHRK